MKRKRSGRELLLGVGLLLCLLSACAGRGEIAQVRPGKEPEVSRPGVSLPDGSLSEAPPEGDSRRVEALLAALGDVDEAMYARLLDVNADGQEDVLLLEQVLCGDRWDWGFAALEWDGEQVRRVDLAQTQFFRDMGSDSYTVWRERETGLIYVMYSLWTDYSVTKGFESVADAGQLGFRYDPDEEADRPDQSALRAAYSEGSEKLQAQLEERFELLETIDLPYPLAGDWARWRAGEGERPGDSPFAETVGDLRQELERTIQTLSRRQ